MSDTAPTLPPLPPLVPDAEAKLPPWPYGLPPMVKLRVAGFVDSFDPKVDGVDVLTGTPTEVPQSALSDVLIAARKSGITLIEE